MSNPTTATIFCTTADGVVVRHAVDPFGDGYCGYELNLGDGEGLSVWILLSPTDLFHPEDCDTEEHLAAAIGQLTASQLWQRRNDIQRANFIARQRERGLPLWPKLPSPGVEELRQLVASGTGTMREFQARLDALPTDAATVQAVEQLRQQLLQEVQP